MSRFPSGINFSVNISPNKTVANNTPTSITLHWWDDPAKRPSFGGVVSWFNNRSAQVSAHYVVEANRITQMVLEKDTAWHSGSTQGNQRSVGIEVNPRLNPGDYETTAQLVAEIWSRLGEVPVYPHHRWSSTSCPGTMDVSRVIRRAREIHRGSSSGGSSGSGGSSTPTTPPRPWETSPRIQGMTAAQVRSIQQDLRTLGYDLGSYGVDGSYGQDTYNAVRKAQNDLGVTVDGVAGPQTLSAIKAKLGGSSSGSSSSGGSSGSNNSRNLTVDGRCGRLTISELQRTLGVTVDGRAGAQTWTALQRHLSAPFVDGKISRQSYRATELGNGIVPNAWEYTGRGSSGSQTVQRLQRKVGVGADGIWFEATTRALQRALNSGSF